MSKSKGHHVWIFCSEPIIAAALRALVDFAMQQAGITNYELFPKQDALVQDAFKKWNFGNYINLPLYGKDVVNGRTTFLDHTDSFMPFTNGCVWAFLQGAKRLSKGDVDDIIAPFCSARKRLDTNIERASIACPGNRSDIILAELF